MNLKEAFRYQNHLDGLMNDAVAYLSDRKHNTSTVQEHHKSSVNADAADATLHTDDIYPGRGEHYDNDKVMEFISALLSEKHCVAVEIAKAKAKNIAFAIDAELAVNKQRQRAARIFSELCRVKPSQRTFKGRDYRFNTDGNHVEYYYDVSEEVKLDFDKELAKRKSKALTEEAESVSSYAELYLLQTQVNHNPRFELSDTFEDAITALEVPVMDEAYINHAV